MLVALTKNEHLTTCYFTKNCLGKQGKDIFYLPKFHLCPSSVNFCFPYQWKLRRFVMVKIVTSKNVNPEIVEREICFARTNYKYSTLVWP